MIIPHTSEDFLSQDLTVPIPMKMTRLNKKLKAGGDSGATNYAKAKLEVLFRGDFRRYFRISQQHHSLHGRRLVPARRQETRLCPSNLLQQSMVIGTITGGTG